MERTLTCPESSSPPPRARDAGAPGPVEEPRPSVGPGDCLGRYSLVARIGSGGMGEVFAARDPELGRTVALKVIRQDRRADPAARLRLLREAQALARLHHPNVVTVHDTGDDGERVFVAMELIEGTTFAAWLRSEKRSFREVMPRLLAAGRGLAAANRAGIVHRDFKPSNVVIGAERVVVVDFGLACTEAGDTADEGGGPVGALETEVTATGALVGTPPYMAPEQRAGHRPSAASDQFSFCVSAWEAIHGQRPASDAPPQPTNASAPRRINEALKRGLSADPASRWPSMDALLDELGRDRRAVVRRVALIAVGLGLLGAAVAGLSRPAAPPPCRDGAARVADAWGDLRRREVEASFRASGSPLAAVAIARVEASLDGYANGWAEMFGETCRATRVDGRQSDSMMDLRMACLERRRSVLANLTELWARGADADAVEHAPEAARSLEPLDACADTRGLAERAPAPANPQHAAQIAAVRVRLDRVEALVAAHRLSEARTAAAEVRKAASGSEDALLDAEVAVAEGDVLDRLRDPEAEAKLVEGARLATAARDDRLAARALVTLVGHLGGAQQNAPRALLVADLADGMVARVDDARLRARLLRNRGAALITRGKLAEAKTELEKARAFAAERFGPRDPETVAAMAALGELARELGDYAGARRLGEEALAATVALLGDDHPRVAEVLTNLARAARDGDDGEAAVAYLRRALAIAEKVSGPDSEMAAATLSEIGGAESYLKHRDRAEEAFSRALSIRERLLGPSHPSVAATLSGIANLRRNEGRFDESIALLQRCLEIWLAAYGPDHPRAAIALHKIGLAYDAAGDDTRALDYFRKALALRERVLGPNHEMTLYTRSLVGGALAKLGRCREARPLLEATQTALRAAVGEEHVDYEGTFAPLARCDLSEGRYGDAADRLERSLEIGKDKPHFEASRALEHRLLAEALLGLGRRDAAGAAIRAATEESAVDPAWIAQAEGRETLAWLAAHAPRR